MPFFLGTPVFDVQVRDRAEDDIERSEDARLGRDGNLRFLWRNGYGSMPIDTIFSGMNIHLPAILIPGVQGFDTLPNEKKTKDSNPSFGLELREGL